MIRFDIFCLFSFSFSCSFCSMPLVARAQSAHTWPRACIRCKSIFRKFVSAAPTMTVRASFQRNRAKKSFYHDDKEQICSVGENHGTYVDGISMHVRGNLCYLICFEQKKSQIRFFKSETNYSPLCVRYMF